MGGRNMSFEDNFSAYEDYAPPGVRLPQIKIEQKYYKKLNIPEDSDNYEFLRQLCLKGIRDKEIDKQENKKDY